MEPSVIVAEDLNPSETVQMDKEKILAFVSVHGSTNSHTAILARMMNIPALVGVPMDLQEIHTGIKAVVDGFSGEVIFEPSEEICRRTQKKKAQYDTSAKRLLGQKSILAHILVKTVDEFKEMNPKDVVSYIEGTPYISAVPVEPGLTNIATQKSGQRVVSFNTENAEVNEGLVRFDIIFYVRMKDGLAQIIVNVEAQKDEPAEYQILNRAIFYVSRLISSQKERDFENSSYDDIKRVYSIWVCMNMTENTMSHIHLTKEDVVGSYEWKGKLDLLNIIMISLAKELPKHGELYELHRLLGALLSQDLTIDQKLDINVQ